MIKKLWHDPVLSKVIAAAICSGLALIINEWNKWVYITIPLWAALPALLLLPVAVAISRSRTIKRAAANNQSDMLLGKTNVEVSHIKTAGSVTTIGNIGGGSNVSINSNSIDPASRPSEQEYDRLNKVRMAFHELLQALIEGGDLDSPLRKANNARLEARFQLGPVNRYLEDLHSKVFQIAKVSRLLANPSLPTEDPKEWGNLLLQMVAEKGKMGQESEALDAQFEPLLSRFAGQTTIARNASATLATESAGPQLYAQLEYQNPAYVRLVLSNRGTSVAKRIEIEDIDMSQAWQDRHNNPTVRFYFRILPAVIADIHPNESKSVHLLLDAHAANKQEDVNIFEFIKAATNPVTMRFRFVGGNQTRFATTVEMKSEFGPMASRIVQCYSGLRETIR